jgi:EmrB/QacA subfamily drug resistance transporter
LAPTKLVPILAGLLLTLLLAALDATIVATAMPSIAANLGGFNRYSWVTVAYLLSSTIAVPVVSKLADQYGRRVFLMGGTILFTFSSVLCAQASSYELLTGFRLLQGVGAGTITAAVFAAVPRLFGPVAAARLIGLFSGTYGLASILGPLLGGVISDAIGWRGVFWINLPIGLAALVLVLLTYPVDKPATRVGWVDYAGAATLIGGMSPVLLALLTGGRDIRWDSPTMAWLLIVGSTLLVAFAWIEHRSVEPIIPLHDLATRALGAPVLGSALMNAGLVATLLFTPLFVQRVIGQSATQSGGVLAPMTTAWVLASVVGGHIIARAGRTRPVGVLGMALGAAGACLMAGMAPGTEYGVVARNLIVVGVGLGMALSAFIVAAQNALPGERAGVALGLSTFARAIGATLASAALGSLLAANVGAAPAAVQDAAGLSSALSRTFLAVGIVLALGAAAAGLIRERPFGVARNVKKRTSSRPEHAGWGGLQPEARP